MWRVLGPDGVHLFQVSEFLNASQVASFFPVQSAAVHQRSLDEKVLQASQEKMDFNQAEKGEVVIHNPAGASSYV